MTVTPIRQPPPDVITGVEQALAVYLLDPTPSTPAAIYARGFLEGALTGARWRHGCHDAADVAAHERFNGATSWSFSPASLPDAIAATRTVRTVAAEDGFIFGAGWLTGFADALHDAPDTDVCGICRRAILLDVDDHGYCQRDGRGCRWHSLCQHVECAEDGI